MIDIMPAVDFLHYSKIMLDETTIEQRLVNLEQTVAELKRLLIAASTPSNWLEIVDGALRSATTHPTLKFLNIAGNISTDLLTWIGNRSF
ncbi:MAG: hypothetical protein ACYTXC_27590 [Nostoc sp.]